MLMMTRIRSLACLATMLMAIASAAWAGEARPLTLGEPAVGSLDTTRRWSIEAEAGQVVRVTAESAAFDTVLELRSPAGEVLAENDDCSFDTTDSCLETVLLPVAGRYEIRVTAFLGAGTGSYTVAVQTSTATPLEMNTATPGRLGGDEQAVGRWSIEAEAGQVVRVTAESAAFDTVLELRSPAGEVLAENDDCSFDTTDSCLETVLLPVAGRYEIRVTAYFDGTGFYEVVAHTVGSRPPTGEYLAELERAAVVGALQQDDQAYASGEHYDEYTIEVGLGETLVAEVQSDAFETYLVVISPSGSRTSRPGAMRHGLSRVRLEIDAAEPGVWQVNVTSGSAAATGAYRLWLDVGSSGPALVRGTLELGDAEGRDGEYVDVHPFEARALDCLAVRLSGPAGLRVRVLGPDGYHAESGTIPADGDTVVLDDVLSGGQHRVLVTGAVGQTAGYTLETGVRCPASGGEPESAAGQTYGIFVGISDYGGGANDLPRTADDARRLAGTLVNAGVLPAGNAIVLTDREATVEGLTEAIEELGSKILPEDRFVLFYSGHAGREPVVSPESADPDGKDETLALFGGGSLRDNEVNDLLSQIKAGLTLVALDTCFAGGFAKDIISVPGRMGLFSSEEDVESRVSPTAGGYLSQFLMDAVAGGRADADGDGAIRAIELRQYLHERFRTDVKGPYDGIVWDRGPAYQHLQVDPGSVRPTDVIFRLQAQPVSGPAAQTLEEIISASLEATGGREAMARVESVRQVGTLSMSTPLGGLEGSLESIIIPNQRAYQRIDIDEYERTTGWNGVAVWQSNNTQGVTDLTGPWAAAVVAESSLHPFWDYGATGPDAAEFSRLADAELAGRNHHVVQVSRQGIDSQVFVDADTMLVSRIQIAEDVPGIGAVTVTGDRYDYKEHGGVMWALGNRVELPGVVTIDARVSVVEVNGEVDHTIFERP